jgi:defect-in-organelle-trafficking protein DotC
VKHSVLVAFLAGTLLLLLGSIALASDEKPAELKKLMQTSEESAAKRKPAPGTARARALSNTARTLGFQRGFEWRHKIIMVMAEARAIEFDRIFNFSSLLLNGWVLPPVIRWAEKAVNVESDDYATSVEASYRIVSPARIVSTPPSWRGYMQADTGDMKPSPEMVPETSDERAAWNAAVVEGWSDGVLHADEVFDMNMAQLVADYRGILRFKMLADKGYVSIPTLAEGNLGVQAGSNVLNIDQKTFRITVPAEFRAAEAAP